MSSAKRLAREILDTRRLALGHATSPQLTSSAIDGGGIDFRDADGNPIAGIGVGDDGGFIIDYTGGPKPPKPSPPTVTADAGIFRIEWDGSFVNEGEEGILATSDTDRVEIHASMDENFVPDRVESFGGAFATLDGGSFTLGPLPEAGTYYFRLVARSKSAQFSEPSDRVEQELAITSIDLEIADAWLTGEAAQNTADGKNSIWRGPDEPEADPDRPFKDGDIWFEMTDDGKSIPNIWDETAGAWVANDDYRQSEIERVQQELREDLDAIVVDGSGTTNYYQGTPPDESSSPPPKEGDLWFDSSDSNKPYIYQDGEWITVRDSFSKAGAAERFASVRDKHSLDNWWSNVPGFALDSSVKPTVPSGASGDATIKIALQGSFDPAGSWVLDETGVSPNGLPIGIESQIYVKSSGGAPTGNFVFGLQMPGGNPASAPVPLDVVSGGGPIAGSTHQLSVSATAKSYAEMYGPIAERMWFSIEITLPAAAAGDFIAFETLSASYLVPSTGIADKAITTEKIAVGAITAESGIIGSINAGTITVGEMDGARIKAQSIYSDKLLIGGDRNLIPNGELDKGSSIGWPSDAEYQTTDVPTGMAAAVTFPAGWGSVSSWRDIGSFPIQPGDTLAYEVWVKADTAGSVLFMEVRDQSGAHLSKASGNAWVNLEGGSTHASYPIGNWTVPTEWTKVVSTLKVGGSATSFYLGTWFLNHSAGTNRNAKVSFAGLKVYKQVGATLIQDGAISTEHIRAGAITAESGIIGSLDANVITVGKIMGNQLDADAINGKTITGATIRTASSGSRVELTQNGLRQYNGLGQVIADLTQGQLSIAGDFHSGVDGGARVSIVDSMWDDIMAPGAGGMETPGVSYTGAGAGLRVGIDGSEGLSIYHLPYGSGESSAVIESPGGLSGINMHSSGFTVMGGLDSEKIKGNGRVFTFKGGSSGGAAVMQSFNLSGNLRTTIGANSTPGIVWLQALDSSGYEAAGAQFNSNGSAGFTATGQGIVRGDTLIVRGDNGVNIFGAAGNVTLTGSRVQSSTIYNTNTSAAPVYINTTGSLGKGGSSSIRYKQDISAGRVLNSILDIEPAQWRYKSEVEAFNEAEAYRSKIGEGPLPLSMSESPVEPGYHYGAIAEQVAELDVPELIRLDEYGRPDGLRYELFGMALIPIVREQRELIHSLESRIEALEEL